MSRQLNDAGEAFRVKVEHLTTNGELVYRTQYIGPYANAATAKGQITLNRRYWGLDGRKFRATVERAATEWHEVEA